MTSDRIDYYANLLRGIQVAELGRKIREILRDATNEEIDACLRRLHEVEKQRDELLAAAVMAVEMIEYNKHERRHVRWKLNDAIASVKEKQNDSD